MLWYLLPQNNDKIDQYHGRICGFNGRSDNKDSQPFIDLMAPNFTFGRRFDLEGISLRFSLGCVVLFASSATVVSSEPNVVPGNMARELGLNVVVVHPHALVPMLYVFRIFIQETTLWKVEQALSSTQMSTCEIGRRLPTMSNLRIWKFRSKTIDWPAWRGSTTNIGNVGSTLYACQRMQ